MSLENYITGSLVISKGVAYKDRIKVFENTSDAIGTDVSEFLISMYQHYQFQYPKFYKMDNLCKLGWLVAEILLTNNSQKEKYQPEEVGIVLSNANNSLDDDIKYFETTKEVSSPSLFVYTLPNIVIGEICIRNNFKGEHAFFIQDTFDPDFIEKQVNYLLDKNILQACICGWVEVLEQEYKAVLFLVEKKKIEGSILFSAKNMESIFGNN